MAISQKQIRDFIFDAVADAEAAGRTKEVCFVIATGRMYEYVDSGAAYTRDGVNVLNTVNGGDTRWVAYTGTDSKPMTTATISSR